MRVNNNVFRIEKRFNKNEVEVSDGGNRRFRLSANSDYSIGDKVRVTNGIITGKIKSETVTTYFV